VRLLKQEKVAALTNNQGLMVLQAGEEGPELATKPHGHGDVHLLLHSSGVAEQWRGEGRKWVAFFQDTNGLVMRSMAAVRK
jgi:UDP-sugar pyrophosphorylase